MRHRQDISQSTPVCGKPWEWRPQGPSVLGQSEIRTQQSYPCCRQALGVAIPGPKSLSHEIPGSVHTGYGRLMPLSSWYHGPGPSGRRKRVEHTSAVLLGEGWASDVPLQAVTLYALYPAECPYLLAPIAPISPLYPAHTHAVLANGGIPPIAR